MSAMLRAFTGCWDGYQFRMVYSAAVTVGRPQSFMRQSTGTKPPRWRH